MKLIDITGKSISGEWGNNCEGENGIPVLRTTNFTDTGNINFANVVLRDIPPKDLSKKFLRKGDIIIEKSGGSDTKPVGRVVYFDSEENKYLINNFTAILRVKDCTKWHPRYVFYALFANYSFGGTKQYENRTTGLHNLKLDQYINAFNIPDIDLPAQRCIAATLDKVSEGIELCRKMMADLDVMVKSRFVEMFGEPSINSMGWPMKPFAETCTLLTGNTPPRAVKEYYGSYIEWIKSDNITTSSLYLTKAAEYLSEEGAKVGRVVHTGTILMTCIAGSLNTVGNVAIVDRDVAFNQQINAFIPQQYETMFLYVLLQLLKPRLHEAASSALKCILNKGNLESYAAIVPNMELQRQFSVLVAEVDKSKFSLQQQLTELETLKKSLMQQYFGQESGQKDAE